MKWIMGHEMDNVTRNGLWDTKWIMGHEMDNGT